ncbi:MAG: DNA polymerase III subunit delta' [Desulfobia sp.]
MLINFQDIIGQERGKNLLTACCSNQKISHAYLFRGPAGVGKKSLARAFAALVNCIAANGNQVCGTCSSCLKFKSGSHPDFLHIQASGAYIKIDQIRDLKKLLNYAPFEGKYRVILIDDIHQNLKGKEAANSLLKSLEEPPPYSIFILTADEAGEVLPTIFSRCQVIPFYPLPHEEVVRRLEAEGIDRPAALALTGLSEGSLGRAFLLANREILDLRREIVETLVFGNDNPDLDRIFRLSDKAAALKEDAERLLDLLANWLRDVILAGQGLNGRLINLDLQKLTTRAVKRWNHRAMLEKLDFIQMARKQLRRNCNSGLVFEVLFFDLL